MNRQDRSYRSQVARVSTCLPLCAFAVVMAQGTAYEALNPKEIACGVLELQAEGSFSTSPSGNMKQNFSRINVKRFQCKLASDPKAKFKDVALASGVVTREKGLLTKDFGALMLDFDSEIDAGRVLPLKATAAQREALKAFLAK